MLLEFREGISNQPGAINVGGGFCETSSSRPGFPVEPWEGEAYHNEWVETGPTAAYRYRVIYGYP